MANIFTRSNNATPAPSRNTFDGSFTNNLTLKAGYLTPCFCKEVLPGDSFKIDATFGFNFQPMVFPVQTNMTARLHFFYVRNRPLWKGWQDFITKTDNPEGDSIPPYIHLIAGNRDIVETGKIGDYLGIPSVYYNTGSQQVPLRLQTSSLIKYDYSTFDSQLMRKYGTTYQSLLDPEKTASYLRSYSGNLFSPEVFSNGAVLSTSYYPVMMGWTSSGATYLQLLLPLITRAFTMLNYGEITEHSPVGSSSQLLVLVRENTSQTIVALERLIFNSGVTTPTVALDGSVSFADTASGYSLSPFVNVADKTVNNTFVLNGLDSSKTYTVMVVPSFTYDSGTAIDYPDSFDSSIQNMGNQNIDASFGLPNSERPLSELPFSSIGNPDGIRISALPFRAYEAIYNSFYRDDRNNPRIVNGEPVYNDWLTTDAGGADMTHYHLFKSNWEQDVFTTSVQSPQQGVAPLVGVTATGLMTFKDDNGNTYTLQATVGEDGETITGISSYSSDMPTGVLRAMVDTISSGISINDFRNVNALQRWLETNMRKGLRYKDQIEAHFGVSPTYSELDMPEFIGGMTRQVNVNRVTNVGQDTPENPLGTLAGNASVIGDAGAPISHYCDEHGWIIGIVSIVPTPVYSQQLNKQLLKTQLLDYYFPEFAHIGYQPILNREIAPLQAFNSGQNLLDNVFGYQRAWYEYLANIDEVHGDFRQSMKDYIIQRIFATVPQLGEQFLTVGDTEVNQVFAVRDDETDSDKIFGQIYFNVMMKRPIPKIGIPRLEV